MPVLTSDNGLISSLTLSRCILHLNVFVFLYIITYVMMARKRVLDGLTPGMA